MVRGPSSSSGGGGGHLENDNNNNIADALPANAAAPIQMLKSVYIWTPAAAMPMSV